MQIYFIYTSFTLRKTQIMNTFKNIGGKNQVFNEMSPIGFKEIQVIFFRPFLRN
jgi:hypothetical protein